MQFAVVFVFDTFGVGVTCIFFFFFLSLWIFWFLDFSWTIWEFVSFVLTIWPREAVVYPVSVLWNVAVITYVLAGFSLPRERGPSVWWWWSWVVLHWLSRRALCCWLVWSLPSGYTWLSQARLWPLLSAECGFPSSSNNRCCRSFRRISLNC